MPALSPSEGAYTRARQNCDSITEGVGAAFSPERACPGAHDRTAAGTQNVSCPSSPSQQLLPGGGSPGQFGASGPLFDKPVASLVLCGYSFGPNVSATSPAHGRKVVSGTAAQQLVTSLENAPKRRPTGACPDYRLAVTRTLVIIGASPPASSLRRSRPTWTSMRLDFGVKR